VKRLPGESLLDYLDREEEAINEAVKGRALHFQPTHNQSSTKKQQVSSLQSIYWIAAHLMINQSHRCYWCCKLLTNQKYHIDHIYPRIRGGANDPSNLRLSCPTCNISKSDQLPMDFALSLFL